MNKAELIDKIAREAGITKAAAGRAIESLIDGIGQSLQRGERAALVGFGTFSLGQRRGRTGRNPQTGATIKIPAKKVVRFRCGKELEELINRG